jgi:hypothetical protein
MRSRRTQLRPKTISTSGVTGQKGVNAIERVVLDMGSRWTPSGPNEVGIDGYIELFDPNSKQSLGLTLAVQSKVVSAIAADSGPTIEYWCDPNDVTYWLNGNTPVILVVSDGTPERSYWISITHYFRDWDCTKPTSVTFHSSEHRFSRDSFSRLAEIAAPKPGLYLAPSIRTETLHTNLLPVEAFPPTICVAGTGCRGYRDAWGQLHGAGGEIDAAWFLWEKKLFTFHDLSRPPWSSICDLGTLEEFSTQEWSESDEPHRQRIFVQLLNQTLKAQLSPDVRYWPKEDCFAILGRPHKLAYQSVRRRSTITVVAAYSYTAADGRTFEWLRHLAFRGQFRSLAGQWYLEITPTYRFTTDGYALDRFHDDRLKGIKRIEGNRAVLSSVLFWASHLRPSTGLFRGTPSPLQFGNLLTFNSDVGIVDKMWLSKDQGSARHAATIAQQWKLPTLEDIGDS